MKSLFPEIEREIASDRLAERREETQRARDWLKSSGGTERWILNRLAQGPAVEANMMFEVMELSEIPSTSMRAAFTLATTVWALWRVGKLSRKPFPNHPSGEKCFIYSLRK